ncbi:unnamed protein product [Adineta steineri]|uniref:G-protein coupled receptors family 1 profile domain-containing protein n=1 Tax=Adineta steineri TaxID=433720 RepID=A0A816APE3_9BILA|nr:unnamed protein product [Adineta steineri]CAF1600156.1 unnamed protein product [Adineta steineri]
MGSFPSTLTNVPSYWPKAEFSLFVLGQILSIPCYFFVAYHIIFEKSARKALHNHVIIILLFYNFLGVTFDLSLTLDRDRVGYVSLFSPTLCRFWQLVDNGIWYGGISLMMWASFERHILVFHSNFVRSTGQLVLVHYIPLIFFSLYAPLLYFYLIFLYPCDEDFDSTSLLCGGICFYATIPNWFLVYDSFVDYTIPILLIVVFSISLLLRFIRQKQRLQQAVTWRQCRKMTIQLTLVSATYLMFDLPYVIIFLVQSCGYPNFASNIIQPYVASLTYVPAIVLPYATLLTLPGLKQKLRSLFFWKRHQRQIVPLTTYT